MRTLLAASLLLGLTACSRGDDTKKDAAKPKEPEKPALGVGDPAPALAAGTWLNGPAVPAFEAGKVYVVDFWAIWCGPCIQLMPHLAELKEEYKGVVVVAATTVDQRNPLSAVKSFVEKRGPKLGFPFAVADTDALDKAYMEAAKRETLPSTFVIDKAGKVAFIGHPMQLDDVLPKVLDGTWKGKEDAAAVEKLTEELNAAFTKSEKDPAGALADLAAVEAKHPYKQKQPMFQATKIVLMVQAKKFDDAKALTEKLLPALVEKKNTGLLNNLRALWSDDGVNPDKKHVGLAVQAAEAVLKIEGGKSGLALIGAAEAHHAAGDKAKAVALAEKAVANAQNDDQKKFFQQQLERYKK